MLALWDQPVLSIQRVLRPQAYIGSYTRRTIALRRTILRYQYLKNPSELEPGQLGIIVGRYCYSHGDASGNSSNLRLVYIPCLSRWGDGLSFISFTLLRMVESSLRTLRHFLLLYFSDLIRLAISPSRTEVFSVGSSLNRAPAKASFSTHCSLLPSGGAPTVVSV
jgi:hypothetical protein